MKTFIDKDYPAVADFFAYWFYDGPFTPRRCRPAEVAARAAVEDPPEVTARVSRELRRLRDDPRLTADTLTKASNWPQRDGDAARSWIDEVSRGLAGGAGDVTAPARRPPGTATT